LIGGVRGVSRTAADQGQRHRQNGAGQDAASAERMRIQSPKASELQLSIIIDP
jgi:hypothetical protein